MGDFMIYTIIPCFNEEHSIKQVIKCACSSKTDKVLVVENGSYDNSLKTIKEIKNSKLETVSFNIPLGHDIPKAVGLHIAKSLGGDSFIFLDGDMAGIKSEDINKIISSLNSGNHLCLTDCYLSYNPRSSLASLVLYFRKLLNRELQLFDCISYSTPSHGPHGISLEIADLIPISFVGIPPLILSFAAKNSFNISIALKKPHTHLKSPERSLNHSLEIADTIIGDTICALNYYKSGTLSRTYKNNTYIGYHLQRRFDILNLITSTVKEAN